MIKVLGLKMNPWIAMIIVDKNKCDRTSIRATTTYIVTFATIFSK